MTDRNPGFYWVRYSARLGKKPEWEIAEYLGDAAWLRTGGIECVGDEDFAEIDERRLERAA